MNYFACLFMLLFGVFSVAHAETYTVKLGNTPVAVIVQPGKGKTFVHLHENEGTALVAAKRYIAQEGGTLITLKHGGARNIVFYLKNSRYEFDPNRIFTDRGIKQTLQKYSHYSVAAQQEIKKLADRITGLLPAGKVIAVHNNRGYSIKEYFPKQSLAADAKALHYCPATNYRNFYFVTKQDEFNRLTKLNFNVALQASNAQDDGSLSYYLGNKNYINIESGYGELSAQLKMLHYA